MRATATLKRKDSTANEISNKLLAVTLRSEISPLVKSTPGSLVTSPDMRQARFKNLNDPLGDTSAQSMSSSGGPAKTIDKRIASTPWVASSSERRTRLPRDFDIAEPSICTMPWFSRRVNGSSKSKWPRSCKTLVKKREYRRCKIAWVTPPTY